jgi:uncharacterized protein (UPF0332 family)
MNEEVQTHLQKAREALTDAELLLAQGSPEATVNRAYYTMFHAASAMHLAEGRKYVRHREMIGNFNRLFVHEGKEVEPRFFEMLQSAFGLRDAADYAADGIRTVSRESAAAKVRDAREFLAMAVAYLKTKEP